MICDNCSAVCLEDVVMYEYTCPRCKTSLIIICEDCNQAPYCPDCLLELQTESGKKISR